jgi:predicted hydrocarbon binding protein
MGAELLISGDNLIHAMDYVKRKKGTDGLDGVIYEAKENLDEIYPDKMYPLAMYIELLEIIQRKFMHSDTKVIYRLGFDRAKGLTFFEYFKNKSDPITLFKMIEKNWRRFNAFGKLEVREEEKASAVIYLCDFQSNPLYCQRMKGFLEGIITAICDMKNGTVVEEQCQVKNGKYCKFYASWTLPEKFY